MSVLTTMTTASASPSSSCGCVGSCGGNCGGSCGTTRAAGGPFRRPAFFAGQLLTEEDLVALVDYVVGKNRLHNRYLFGDGVVCGLQLACDPCDPAVIRVMPGYALDCCGNDILVSCPKTLDIKALLRDLRARQAAGYQCGDPCDPKDGPRRYGLYLTYRETPVDAVAPYASGDPCGQQQCQPTRIAEGYGFELRCDCTNDSGIDVFKRILACVGDIRDAAAAVARAQSNQVIAARMEHSLYKMKSDPSASAFTADDATAIHAAPQVMDKLSAAGADAAKENKLPEESEFRSHISEFQRTTAAMARFRAQSPEIQRATLANDPGLSNALETADAKLTESSDAVKTLSPKVIFDPTMATLASESAVLSDKYSVRDAPPEAYGTMEARMMMAGAPITRRQSTQMKGDAGLLKQWLLERLENSCSITSCALYDRARAVRTGDPGADIHDEAETAATASAVRELTVILVQYFIDCICQALNPACPDCTENSVLLGCVEVEECRVLDLCNLSRRFVLAPTSIRYWLPPIGWFGKLVEKLCCEFDPSRLFRRQPEPVPVPDAAGRPQSAVAVGKPMMMASYAPVLRSGSLDETSMSVLRRLDLTAKDAENVSAFASNMARLAMHSAEAASDTIRPAAEAVLAKFAGSIDRFRESPAAPVAAPTAAIDETALRSKLTEEMNASLAKEREARAAEFTHLLELQRRATDEAIKAAADADAKSTRLASDLDFRLAEDRKASDAKLAAALEQERAASAAAVKTAVASAAISNDDVKAAVTKELSTTRIASSVENLSLVKKLRTDNAKLADQISELKTAVAELRKRG